MAVFFILLEEVVLEALSGMAKGDVKRNVSGPVDSLSANEAEVYALLIGCHELLTLESINVVIEGDSYLAIQWGSGKLLFHGDCWIGWRRCKIFLDDWVLLFTISFKRLMSWQMLL